MRKILFFLLSIPLLYTCAITKHQNLIVGEFKGLTPRMGSFVPPGEMILSLKPDGAFNLYWLGVNYTGKWKNLTQKHLILKFDEITDISILLRSGTISDEDKGVRIISRNKIIILPYNYVLKREK